MRHQTVRDLQSGEPFDSPPKTGDGNPPPPEVTWVKLTHLPDGIFSQVPHLGHLQSGATNVAPSKTTGTDGQVRRIPHLPRSLARDLQSGVSNDTPPKTTGTDGKQYSTTTQVLQMRHLPPQIAKQ